MQFRRLQTIREKTFAALRLYRRRLTRLLPDADIQHVGSTAIPGTITKGDLDIVVRVEQKAFPEAEKCLAEHFERNISSHRRRTFASFKDDFADPPLGIQLAGIGGPEDNFVVFRDALCADATLVKRYNALKRRARKLTMNQYRRRKGAFIERVLAKIRIG